jgi:hypothetical protein
MSWHPKRSRGRPSACFWAGVSSWDQRHTQRLHEARLPEKQDLLKPGLIGRTTEFLRHLPPEHSAVGGDPAIHGVEPAESDIWMDISDRVGHTLVLGTTRVGKTGSPKCS